MFGKIFLPTLIFLLIIVNPCFANTESQKNQISSPDSYKYPIYKDILDYKTEAKQFIDAKHSTNLGDQSQNKEIPPGFALADVRDVVLVGSAKQIEKNSVYVVLSKSAKDSVQYFLAQFKSGKNAQDFLTELSLKKGDTVYIKEDLLSPHIDFLLGNGKYISAAARVSAVNNKSDHISDTELKDSIVKVMIVNSIFQRR
jgi:hypothetical protein